MNRLKMNDLKTEFIVFGSNKILNKFVLPPLYVNEEPINTVDSVKLLGCELDQSLTFAKFISSKCKTANFMIRKISAIRSYLTISTCQQLMTSLVLSKLDYCNSILAGVSDTNLRKLQVVQNYAARVVCRKNRYQSAKDCLKSLHWLPIKFRIVYKILTLVHNCIYGHAPEYLKNLLTEKPKSQRNLRSNNSGLLLTVPPTKRKTFQDRSFCVYGPKAWNGLPEHIRSINSLNVFKKKLKTHLFLTAFSIE